MFSRRQTHLIKRAIDIDQTYLVAPSACHVDSKDPIAFAKRSIEQDGQDISGAILKYLEFAKNNNIQFDDVSEYQREGKSIFRLCLEACRGPGRTEV